MPTEVMDRPSRPLWPTAVEGVGPISAGQQDRNGAPNVLQLSLGRAGALACADSRGRVTDLDLALQGAHASVAGGLVLALAPDPRRAQLAAQLRRALRAAGRDGDVAVSCVDPLVLEELRAQLPRVRLLVQVPDGADVARSVCHLVRGHVCGVHLTLKQALACARTTPIAQLAARHDLSVVVEASGATDVARARRLGADLVLPATEPPEPGPVGQQRR